MGDSAFCKNACVQSKLGKGWNNEECLTFSSAAVQPNCSFQYGVHFKVDVLPLLNTFSNTSLPQYFHSRNTTHMVRGPGPFCRSSRLRCSENLTFLQKRSAHILSSLFQGREMDMACSILWKPNTSMAEQKRAGRHAAVFYMTLVLGLWWHCFE